MTKEEMRKKYPRATEAEFKKIREINLELEEFGRRFESIRKKYGLEVARSGAALFLGRQTHTSKPINKEGE